MTRYNNDVGDFISTDKFICKTPGRLPTSYGRYSTDFRFQGGTIYNDEASDLIWIENQVSLGSNKTVMGKSRFEQWFWGKYVTEVSHYHGGNGIFTADEYQKDCDDKGQTQIFSGFVDLHQNPREESAIQTIIYIAHTCMVQTSLNWTDRGADAISLLSLSVKHSVWLYNRLLNKESGLTPLEIFTSSKYDYHDLLHFHVWGCPIFLRNDATE